MRVYAGCTQEREARMERGTDGRRVHGARSWPSCRDARLRTLHHYDELGLVPRATRQQRVPALRRGRSRPAASGAAVPGMRHAACCHQAFAGRPAFDARDALAATCASCTRASSVRRIDRERGEDARLYGRFCNHGRRREVRGRSNKAPRGRERAATTARRCANVGATMRPMRATRSSWA